MVSATPSLVINTFMVGAYPGGIAIDAAGNIWVANYSGDTISELTSASGFTTTNTYLVSS